MRLFLYGTWFPAETLRFCMENYTGKSKDCMALLIRILVTATLLLLTFYVFFPFQINVTIEIRMMCCILLFGAVAYVRWYYALAVGVCTALLSVVFYCAENDRYCHTYNRRIHLLQCFSKHPVLNSHLYAVCNRTFQERFTTCRNNLLS